MKIKILDKNGDFVKMFGVAIDEHGYIHIDRISGEAPVVDDIARLFSCMEIRDAVKNAIETFKRTDSISIKYHQGMSGCRDYRLCTWSYYGWKLRSELHISMNDKINCGVHMYFPDFIDICVSGLKIKLWRRGDDEGLVHKTFEYQETTWCVWGDLTPPRINDEQSFKIKHVFDSPDTVGEYDYFNQIHDYEDIWAQDEHVNIFCDDHDDEGHEEDNDDDDKYI